jgi:uncharacterized protein
MHTVKVGNCIAKPGTTVVGKLRVATLPTGHEHAIPVAIMQGKKPGPTAFVSGGMHGDEVNGVELVQRFQKSIFPAQVKGTIIFLPLLNPSGFIRRQRYVFFDNKDLNRSFSTSEEKTVSNDIAGTILDEVVSQSAFGVDCHDAGSQNVLFPQARVHPGKDTETHGLCEDGCTIELGSIFGGDLIINRQGAEGMLALEAFKKLKTPVLTVECGGAGIIFNDFIQRSVQGLHNCLAFHSMLPGKIQLPKYQIMLSDEHRFHQLSPHSGLFYRKVKLGQLVKKGQVIGSVFDPYTGETKSIKAEDTGILFSVKMHAAVSEGEALFSMLRLSDIKKGWSFHHLIISNRNDKKTAIKNTGVSRIIGKFMKKARA